MDLGTDRRSRTNPEAIFCRCPKKPILNPMTGLIAHGTLILIFILGIISIKKFYDKRTLFPVRERSPRLALIQSIIFLSLIFFPYCCEFFIVFGIWKENEDKKHQSLSDVTLLRKIFKALYMTARLNCNFLFLLRVLVIYSRWKLRKRNKLLNNLLKSEKKIILVNLFFNSKDFFYFIISRFWFFIKIQQLLYHWVFSI